MIASGGVASEQIEKCCIHAIFLSLPTGQRTLFRWLNLQRLVHGDFPGRIKSGNYKKNIENIEITPPGFTFSTFRACLNGIAIAVSRFCLSLTETPAVLCVFQGSFQGFIQTGGWMCKHEGSWDALTLVLHLEKVTLRDSHITHESFSLSLLNTTFFQSARTWLVIVHHSMENTCTTLFAINCVKGYSTIMKLIVFED